MNLYGDQVFRRNSYNNLKKIGKTSWLIDVLRESYCLHTPSQARKRRSSGRVRSKLLLALVFKCYLGVDLNPFKFLIAGWLNATKYYIGVSSNADDRYNTIVTSTVPRCLEGHILIAVWNSISSPLHTFYYNVVCFLPAQVWSGWDYQFTLTISLPNQRSDRLVRGSAW